MKRLTRHLCFWMCLVLPQISRGADSTADFLPAFQKLCSKMSSLGGISIKAVSESKMDSDFATHNPKYLSARYGSIFEAYAVDFDSDHYRINFGGRYGDSSPLPDVACSYDGVSTIWRYSTGSSISAKIRKGSKATPDSIVALGTVFFLPFAFLETAWEQGMPPILTPASFGNHLDLHSLKITKIENQDPATATLTIEVPNRGYFLVTLDKRHGLFPESLKLFNEENRLLFSLESRSISEVTLQGEVIPYAKEFTVETYVDGYRMGQREVKIEEVKESGRLSSGDFAIDLASCTSIWDEDNHVRIKMPR